MYPRPEFLQVIRKSFDNSCFEIPAGFWMKTRGRTRHSPQPKDLADQPPAMPAYPEMHANLLPVGEIQTLYLIRFDEFRDLAAMHYVN